MKKALIDIYGVVNTVVGWDAIPDTDPQRYSAVMGAVPNALRICQVEAVAFDVATPLYWVDCPDETIADVYYYDGQNCVLTPTGVPYPTGE
jgi:hypothetical protein